MRIVLLLSLMLASGANLLGQAQPAPAQPTAKPPLAAPGPRRITPISTRGGMVITVTDFKGVTLPGVHVELLGASDRSADTNAIGQVSFSGLQAATYRLRLSGDAVISFEREVVLRAGMVTDLDVSLNPAPRTETPPPTLAPGPAPVVGTAALGPAGQPQTLSLVDLAERELIGGRDSRKDTLVACSGNTRSMLVQLNQPQAERVYEAAEALYYVIAGQGTVTVNGRDVPLQAGGYVSLPRGAGHSLARKGNRPLILLAVLSGEPCSAAK